MPVDLDALAVQVGRETLADLEEWPIATPPRDRIMVGVRDDSLLGRTAILGARAMLAKLRELGLVVEPGVMPVQHNREPTAADFPTAYRPIKSITSNGTGHD